MVVVSSRAIQVFVAPVGCTPAFDERVETPTTAKREKNRPHPPDIMRDVPSILKQDVPIVKADHTERREHLEKSRLPADDEAGEAKNREDKEGEDRLWSVQHKHKAEGVRSQSVKFREDIHVGEPA